MDDERWKTFHAGSVLHVVKQKLGRYEMLTPIAAGGMASVWVARLRGAADFDKLVAVKTMLPELASEGEYRTMFLDEARIASKLRHPNVCETFDLGEERGTLYLAMEWVDGVSLHRLRRDLDGTIRAIRGALGARIVAGACAGLHAAHEANDDDGSALAIVHRDVSPQNILVSSDGHVKVTDFGIAKAVGKHHATRDGQAKGKLAYMAPEQLRGKSVDRRADVFALGAVLYEITTGRRPFSGESDALLVDDVLHGIPVRPTAIIEDYPLELERIVARAMAKDPADRFASAEGLRLALERWLATTPSTPTDRDVAALVHRRCGREIEQRREEVRAASHERSAAAAATSTPVADATPAPSTAAETRAPKRRHHTLTLALGSVVAAVSLGTLVWSGPIEPASAPTAAVAGRADSVASAAAPVPASPLASVEARAVEGRSTIRFVIDAPGALLVVDGEPLDDGVTELERPEDGHEKLVLVRAPGRVDRLFVLGHESPKDIEASLGPAEPFAATE